MLVCMDSIVSLLIAIVPLLVVPTPALVVVMPIVRSALRDLPGWTLDVWWLTSFDGRVGKGWSFLVDVSAAEADRVLSSREFTIRAG